MKLEPLHGPNLDVYSKKNVVHLYVTALEEEIKLTNEQARQLAYYLLFLAEGGEV